MVSDLGAFLNINPAQVYEGAGGVMKTRAEIHGAPARQPFSGTLDELKAVLGGALMGAG